MKQAINEIKLGNRQLTFGFEDGCSKNQEIVLSALNDLFESQGEAVLDTLVEGVATAHGLAETEIVQATFWLAEDLKIQFRVADENRDPYSVLKILRANPNAHVIIIPPAQVDEDVFLAVKTFFQELTGLAATGNGDDQHTLARRLMKTIKNWDQELRSCLSKAHQPHFPGKAEIGDCLDTLERITARCDAFSLITAVHQNRPRLKELKDRVQAITGFYSQHIDFWHLLVQSMADFDKDRMEFQKDLDVAEALDRLQILFQSDSPYDAMDQIGVLYGKVKFRHDEIVKKRTEEARKLGLAELDRMIQRMRAHLDRCQAAPDLRNEALYSLRQTAKQITVAENITRIEQLMEIAAENFETMWDDAAQN